MHVDVSLSTPRDAAAFRPHARGGMWWTWLVNQWVGSHIAAAAHARGWRPRGLSLANCLIGAATAAIVGPLLLAHMVVPAAVAGFLGWQLAYSCDCADGQLARATSATSKDGALLDLLADFAVQALVLTCLMLAAAPSLTPGYAPLAALIAAGWLSAPFYSGIQAETPPSRVYHALRARFRVVKQVRDYGLQVAVFPILLVIGSLPTLVGLLGVAAVNALFIAMRIGTLVYASHEADG